MPQCIDCASEMSVSKSTTTAGSTGMTAGMIWMNRRKSTFALVLLPRNAALRDWLRHCWECPFASNPEKMQMRIDRMHRWNFLWCARCDVVSSLGLCAVHPHLFSHTSEPLLFAHPSFVFLSPLCLFIHQNLPLSIQRACALCLTATLISAPQLSSW